MFRFPSFSSLLRSFFREKPKAPKEPQRQHSPKPEIRVATPSVVRTPPTRPLSPEAKASPKVGLSYDKTLSGKCYVVDGDTIRIGKINIRLAGIDAPELEHPWGQKSKWELVRLCKGQVITAELEPDISYDRVVATCFLPDGRDLSAEMVKAGLAIDWPKFSGGKYSEFEPDGVRKKHWKAAARQRGHMHVFNK